MGTHFVPTRTTADNCVADIPLSKKLPVPENYYVKVVAKPRITRPTLTGHVTFSGIITMRLYAWAQNTCPPYAVLALRYMQQGNRVARLVLLG